MPRRADPRRAKPYFLGGIASDFATSRRIDGFRSVAEARTGPLDKDQIIPCGYAPMHAAREIEALCDRIGGLPAAIFVNSLTAFEGVLGYFVHLEPEAFKNSVIGCYDYDPFAAYLQFPVHMVRQNSSRLIALAYELIEAGTLEHALFEIAPDLVPPRTIVLEHHGERD